VLPCERPAALATWLSVVRAASSERFHGTGTEIRVAKLPARFSGGCADWLSKAALSTRQAEAQQAPARRHGSAAVRRRPDSQNSAFAT
jgi:hypothetical protein